MQTRTIEDRILESLARVAPGADTAGLDPGVAFRDQIELDSVDYLRFVMDLQRQLGLRIPEIDYPKLATLAGCAAYVRRLGAG